MGKPVRYRVTHVCNEYFGDELEFYDKLSEISWNLNRDDGSWQVDAVKCAATLRIYADKHYPEASGELPPSITRIFETEKEVV